jgi:lipopolysaccharide export system protein LptA
MKMDDGTVVQQGRIQLSADGKVITREAHGKNPETGGESKRLEVYDKQ